MPKNIVIAVDSKERTLDALALGHRLADATGAPAVLVTVFAHHPLHDPEDPELISLRAQARDTLLELARAEGLEVADARVIPGNFAARELQRVTEQPETGLIVVGSTTRGLVGRLLVGGVGERLLAGGACPVAVAPRGYGEEKPSPLRCIGIGFDGSHEAQIAVGAAVVLAQACGARIRLITVFQRLAFGAATTTALPGESANEVMRRELREVHDAAIGAIPPDVEAESRFRDGAADEVLVEESGAVDLLVVGSRGYGPRGAVLLGSASTALARAATSPLIVMPREAPFDLLP
ncbi:MAG TPA: universal stress protein [Solirubrobacteraceae bacterium]|nr:universal stress protein [Solirubrobacteraceae bacterium]